MKIKESLIHQIILAVIVSSFAIMTSISIYNGILIDNSTREQYRINTQNVCKLFDNAIRSFNEELKYETEVAAKDEYFVESMNKKSDEAIQKYLEEIYSFDISSENVFIAKVKEQEGFDIIADAQRISTGMKFGTNDTYRQNWLAAKQNKTHVSTPSQSPATKRTVVLCTVPFAVQGDIYAFCYSKYLDTEINTIVNNAKIGKGGYPFAFKISNGLCLAHPNDSVVWNLHCNDVNIPHDKIRKGNQFDELLYTYNNVDKAAILYRNNEYDYCIAGAYNLDEIDEIINASLWNNLLFCVISIILISTFIYFYFTRQFKPLKVADKALNELANGNLMQTIEIPKGKNEIVRMSKSLQTLILSWRNIIISLHETVNELQNGSTQMTNASNTLSESTSMQAASSEEIATSIEEMTASIHQNSDNSSTMTDYSLKAGDGIKDLNKLNSRTSGTANEFTSLIEKSKDIAESINLLSLNAAIEATQAGQYGQGFKVIATEIRALANNTKSYAEILMKKSDELNEDAAKGKETCDELIPILDRNQDNANEIYSSSMEQASSMQQINSAIVDFNNSTQNNSGVAEELSANAEELDNQIVQLSSIVSQFQFERNTKVTEKKTVKKENKKVRAKKENKGIIIKTDDDTVGYEKF